MPLPASVALELKTRQDVALAAEIDPTIKELDFEKDLQGNFFILNFPHTGDFVVMPARTVDDNFERAVNWIHGFTLLVKT